jgi:hypothetical protein
VKHEILTQELFLNHKDDFVGLDHLSPYIPLYLNPDKCLAYMFFSRSNKAVAICGILELWKNVGEAWSIINTDQISKFIARNFRREIKRLLKEKYHRIQMTTDVDDPKALALAKMLGFSIEGVMKKYSTEKKNHFMHSITRK